MKQVIIFNRVVVPNQHSTDRSQSQMTIIQAISLKFNNSQSYYKLTKQKSKQ